MSFGLIIWLPFEVEVETSGRDLRPRLLQMLGHGTLTVQLSSFVSLSESLWEPVQAVERQCEALVLKLSHPTEAACYILMGRSYAGGR